jgi:hypothetical protein
LIVPTVHVLAASLGIVLKKDPFYGPVIPTRQQSLCTHPGALSAEVRIGDNEMVKMEYSMHSWQLPQLGYVIYRPCSERWVLVANLVHEMGFATAGQASDAGNQHFQTSWHNHL